METPRLPAAPCHPERRAEARIASSEVCTKGQVKFLRSEVILRIVKFCSITRKVSLKRCHPERSVSGVEPVRAMLCIGISPFPPRLPAARDPARQSLALLRSSTSLRMTRAVISASLRQQLHCASNFTHSVNFTTLSSPSASRVSSSPLVIP